MVDKGTTYSFLVEWYDSYSTSIKKFKLIYDVRNKSVEMHDYKLHRLFLKPTKVDDLSISNLYPGSSVTILSRTLKVVDFADEFTKKSLSSMFERYVCFIRSSAVCKAGKILLSLENEGIQLINLKIICLNSDEVRRIFANITDSSKFSYLLNEMADKLVVAIELMGNQVCERIIQLIGEGSLEPSSGYVMNADLLAITQSANISACLSEQIFGSPGGPNFRGLPRLHGTTLAVIKPHAVIKGLTGQIWDAIQSRGFCVTAARLFRLSKADAAEFLEVYKGVAHEYPEMLDQLSSGPCVAMEVAATDSVGDVHQSFREFVGPMDPEIARFLRPESLRARFGVDKVRNAVHCTDLPDDCELEVNFFFRVLDK